MFNQVLASNLTLAASATSTLDITDVFSYTQASNVIGVGTVHLKVTAGSVKLEWVARNNASGVFCPVEGAEPVVAASATGEKLYKTSPPAAQDIALRVTDVSGSGSTVDFLAVSLL